MDQSGSDRNPTIPSMTVLFRPIQVMFNNVDMINVVTNSNDKERTIPIGYYSIDEIIVILSIMTDSTFSISTKASSYGCIWIQYPHTIDFTNALDILEILGLEGQTVILPALFNGSNVIEITRNLQVIQVYSSLDRSSDLKIGDRNNNLFTTLIIDDPTTNYCRLMEDICISVITRFDRLMFVFKDLEGRIMHLNGEFEFQLAIEDRVEDEVEGVLTLMSANQLSMIEVFGSRKKEVKLDNPLSFD